MLGDSRYVNQTEVILLADKPMYMPSQLMDRSLVSNYYLNEFCLEDLNLRSLDQFSDLYKAINNIQIHFDSNPVCYDWKLVFNIYTSMLASERIQLSTNRRVIFRLLELFEKLGY